MKNINIHYDRLELELNLACTYKTFVYVYNHRKTQTVSHTMSSQGMVCKGKPIGSSLKVQPTGRYVGIPKVTRYIRQYTENDQCQCKAFFRISFRNRFNKFFKIIVLMNLGSSSYTICHSIIRRYANKVGRSRYQVCQCSGPSTGGWMLEFRSICESDFKNS